ncbi:MAG: TonB-dependent receptor [Gammaproteobacteria bacterium]
MRLPRIAGSAVAFCVLASGIDEPALAQMATTSVAVGDDSVLEEVIVTARRRSENLQDIADAITVFDRAAIEDASIQRMNDVAALTPNLRFSDDQEVGQSTITIRGVTQQRGIGETPLAFVVDGVTVNNSLVTTQDLFDVEQIEVLRGPQGALYGRNSVAGAVNITTRGPTEDFEAYVETRAAEGDDYTLQAAISGPVLSDKVRGRLAIYSNDRDGQLRNEGLGEYVDFKDSTSVRGRLLIEPNQRLSLDLRYQHADQEAGSGYFMPGSADTEENRLPGDTFPYPLNNTTYTIQSNVVGVSDVGFSDYTAKLDYEFDAFTLTSITGWHDLESNNDQDLDQTNRDFLNIDVNDDQTQFSQELRLVSSAEEGLRWILGAYYSEQERDRSLATFLNVSGFVNGGDWSPESAFFVPQPPAILNEQYETRAVFGQASLDVTERIEVTVAGRFDDVRRENDTNNPAANGVKEFSEFQPKLQVSYRLTDTVNLFATYAEGFRPGGFNTLANDPAVQFAPSFDSEHLDNYELGVKYGSADGRLIVNVAAFYIDYEDQQYFLFDPFGSQALINAKKSEIVGGELEAVLRPLDGLTIALAYGFVDSEIEDIEAEPGLTVPPSDVIGNEVPGAPVSSLNLTFEYLWPIGSLQGFARLDAERRGKTYWSIDGRDVQEAYEIYDVRLGLRGSRWSVTLFAENATDEEWIEYYVSRRFTSLRTDIAWPSPPRQVGLEAAYRF